MFIVALFTIAKTWKQPKCPSTDDWIRKMWYIYTMECYSATKKKEQNNAICSHMENSMEVPQKTIQRTIIRPSNPTLGHTSRQNFP